MNDDWANNLKGSDFWNGLVASPSALAWAGYWLAILLGPHFAEQPDPMLWALYAACGWAAVLLVLVGGWLALVVLAASF